MQALFDKELTEMEREVRDLKTSHAIPIGSLNFYQKSGTVSMVTPGRYGFYLRATVKAGEPANPYIQVFAGRTSDGRLLTLYQEQSIVADGTIIQYYFNVSSNEYQVIVTCTSDFDLIVKEYEEGDWISE